MCLFDGLIAVIPTHPSSAVLSARQSVLRNGCPRSQFCSVLRPRRTTKTVVSRDKRKQHNRDRNRPERERFKKNRSEDLDTKQSTGKCSKLRTLYRLGVSEKLSLKKRRQSLKSCKISKRMSCSSSKYCNYT